MVNKIKSLLKNDFIRGSFFFTSSSFLISFLNYLFNFLSARTLGPQGYGEITALFSYLSITAIPTFVISSFIIQKIASSGNDKFQYASQLEELFWRKIKKYWYLPVILIPVIPFISKLTNLSPTTSLFVIPLIILSFIGSFYGSAQQGLNLLLIFSLVGLTATLIKLSGPILVIMGIDGYLTIIIMILLSSLLPMIASILIMRSLISKKTAQNLSKIETKVRSLLFNRQFLLILASILGLNLLNNFDIIFVKKFFSPAESGIYSSWSLFAKIILYLIGPFISVSFIFFSGEKKKNKNIFRLSLFALLMIGLISYIIYTYFSQIVVGILFGKKFLAVLPYLSRAAIFGSLYTSITFINNYYVAKKSLISLIVPVFVPVYLFFIFFIKRNLDNIILLNILFSLSMLFIHFVFYLKEELRTASA